jgi:hypothetical protein
MQAFNFRVDGQFLRGNEIEGNSLEAEKTDLPGLREPSKTVNPLHKSKG